MTTTEVPTPTPSHATSVVSAPLPAAQRPAETGLLGLRAFVILLCSLVTALITGTGAGLAAASTIEQAPALAGAIAGLAAGITTFLGTAVSMNALISHAP